MGSRDYAQRIKQRGEPIDLMISLETIGYYSDHPGSQSYPPPLSFFYPNTGNFIAFVSNTDNGLWVETITDVFRQEVQFPSEGAALWGWIPGVGQSGSLGILERRASCHNGHGYGLVSVSSLSYRRGHAGQGLLRASRPRGIRSKSSD